MPQGRKSLHVLAAVAYVLTALWIGRVVLPAPATLVAYPAFHDQDPTYRILSRIDLANEVSAMLRSAHLWPRAPHRLLEGDCYPVPEAATRGEHMIGEGLAAVVPYALTGEPILAYNAVVYLWLALAGITMYALAFHWTGSSGAAFVAGLIFLLQPVRASDPHHPFIHADHWIPLVLLCLHRLFLHERWRDVALLCVATLLQLLASAYNVVEAGLVIGVCGVAMLAHHRHAILRLLPKLAATAGFIAVTMVVLFAPFARTRRVWPGPPHFSMPLPLADFLPGGVVFPGWVALALATVALLDRLVRRRSGEDPRLPMLCAGALCFWATAPALLLPWGAVLPNPMFSLIRLEVLSALSGLRALHLVSQGVLVAAAFLAGYGVVAVARRVPRRARRLVPVLAAVTAAAQVLVPSLSRPTFGSATLEMRTLSLRPPQPLIDLFGVLEPGAVLDLPFTDPRSTAAVMTHVPHYALLRTYHQQRIAACAASLRGPAEHDVGALGARLPQDRRAADALYALGFRSVVVHHEFLDAAQRTTWEAAARDGVEDGSRLRLLGATGQHAVFTLASPVPITASHAPLAPGTLAEPLPRVRPGKASIPFVVRNQGETSYRHPDPIEPTPVVVRWRGPASEQSYALRTLLPLALAAGEQTTRAVESSVPETRGRYELTLELDDASRTVLARTVVEVDPSARDVGATAPLSGGPRSP